VPSILFPLVFLLAFAGGLSSVGDTPGFDFRSGYTSFQFVFVLLQAAAFSGVFTGFGVAAAFESGFGRRLMLAAPSRAGIVAGYLLASLGRFAFTAFMLTVVGLLAGMEVDGTSGQYAALILLAFGLNTASTLFGVGFALRTRTIQAAPAMQIPVFTILFLAPVFVPLELLDGWIASVAGVNPITALVQAGRGFISGRARGIGPRVRGRRRADRRHARVGGAVAAQRRVERPLERVAAVGLGRVLVGPVAVLVEERARLVLVGAVVVAGEDHPDEPADRGEGGDHGEDVGDVHG
jgi:ABC-2 type transport system permease protein